MRRIALGLIVAVTGVFAAWAGQGFARDSLDTLWAAVAVISVLSALSIAMHRQISRLLAPITGARNPGA